MKAWRSRWMVCVVALACVMGGHDVTFGAARPQGSESASRCGCSGADLALTSLEVLPAAATEARAMLPEGDPIQSVLFLFAAFEARDPNGWVRMMSRKYRFDSDDHDFVRSHPEPYTRGDELAFATKLFRGGGRGPDGRALPIVTQVEAPLGAVWVEMRELAATRAVAHVERWGYVLVFDDGSRLELAGTDNTLELAREDGEWRVVAWHERLQAGALAGAAPADRNGAAAPAPDVVPERLALRRLGGLAAPGLAFELDLPSRGGKLELFDVQGRRIAQRSLEGLAPGVRRVELPAAGVPAGAYWARVQQAGVVVTTRVIRL